ncbi:MAG: efflux RND transporter permease subunit [Planctomycetota bacterium]|jgi:HAE1 family hydrophobic/amphiphilic exporter-1|nr:efflux RND transporter permease subunit [Planctomycetota bacterium]
MRAIVAWTIRNMPAMNTLMVAVLLVGAMAFATMRREVFPEFDLEIVLVTVPYPGATPEEVEEGICQKIEEACRSVEGIKKITSVAQEGSGFCVFELRESVEDVQKTLAEIRSEVDRIPSFPELSEDPKVEQVTLRTPAIKVGVLAPPASQGAVSEEELRDVAEAVRDDLLTLPAVSAANLQGARDYEIDIEISEATLRKYGLSLQAVADIVRRENIELPGGVIRSESGEILLRGKNKRYSGEEIATLPLVTMPDGLVLTVGDLATVRDEFADVASTNQINGRPGMVVSVDRTSSEDLLAMVAAVKGYVTDAALPPGYELVTWADQSVDVRDRLDMLVSNGLQGLAVVFVVLALFLDLKIAFWVSLGIPFSMLGTGMLMLTTDQTLNMLSMFAFLMAIGIVVDDAVVVSDNIERHRRMGKGLMAAAIDGTVEVIPSVVSSVTTTVITFMPLCFVSGVMGKFIAVMPFAFITALLMSLFESTLVLPGHLAHEKNLLFTILGVILYPLRLLLPVIAFLQRACERTLKWVVRHIYSPLLDIALDNRLSTLAVALGILLVAMGIVRSGVTPFTLFPKIDANRLLAKIVFPDGTPADVTEDATRRIEEAAFAASAKFSPPGEPIVTLVHRAVGQVAAQGEVGPDARMSGSHVGAVALELVDGESRDITSEEFISEWRQAAGEFAGTESLLYGTENIGPGGKTIEFKLLAASQPEAVRQLEAAVERCKEWLAQYPGVIDIDDDSRPGKWEYQIKVKPRAEALGVSLADLAGTIRASYYGEEVMRLQRGRHEVKLMVRYPQDERRSFATLEDIRVTGPDGVKRPLSELADITVARGYSEINRLDQKRSITVTADIDIAKSTLTSGQITADMEKRLMPGLLAEYPEVRVRWEGQREQTNESLRSLGIGFIVALFAMFILLTMEFKSYFQPLLIIFVIPFGCAGAVFGHALMGMPLTLFSMFGLVALSGVVVNDSIVLIDFINHRVRAGHPLREALREAGCLRFRPVLLTSVTTIGGLTPLLLETSFQAQFLVPMATSMAFGLMTTTLIVLILVPVMYSFFGETAREGYLEEQDTAAGESLDNEDAADADWLPDDLRHEPRPQPISA